jgi:hypothetical protein
MTQGLMTDSVHPKQIYFHFTNRDFDQPRRTTFIIVAHSPLSGRFPGVTKERQQKVQQHYC